MGRKSEKIDAAERLPVVDLRGTPLGAEIDRVLDESRVEGLAMRAKYGSPEVIDEGDGVGAKIAPTEGGLDSIADVVLGPEVLADILEDLGLAEEKPSEVDGDLAETIERVEEEIDARIEGFVLERKVSKYEGYFGAALSGVVAYFGADGDQHGVLVEMAHEIAVKALETADGRRLDVLGRIEAWGMMEEV